VGGRRREEEVIQIPKVGGRRRREEDLPHCGGGILGWSLSTGMAVTLWRQ